MMVIRSHNLKNAISIKTRASSNSEIGSFSTKILSINFSKNKNKGAVNSFFQKKKLDLSVCYLTRIPRSSSLSTTSTKTDSFVRFINRITTMSNLWVKVVPQTHKKLQNLKLNIALMHMMSIQREKSSFMPMEDSSSFNQWVSQIASGNTWPLSIQPQSTSIAQREFKKWNSWWEIRSTVIWTSTIK